MSLREQLNNLKASYSDQLTKDQALDLALKAAELHIKFLNIVKTKSERDEIRQNCNAILGHAERIKASDTWESDDDLLLKFEPLRPSVPHSADHKSNTDSDTNDLLRAASDGASDGTLDDSPAFLTAVAATGRTLDPAPLNSRKLPADEQVILLQNSKLHGFKFPPWKLAPAESEFSMVGGGDQFKDEHEIAMSDGQLALLEGWKRPNDALPPPSWNSNNGFGSPVALASPTMKAVNKIDLVQDAATDCSVVASLTAATARAYKGHAKLLPNIIFPYDSKNERPAMSPNGKYVMRLNFNGCARKVIIDDLLPVSKTVRVLHVVDRSNAGLLWPALLEKAYLKVRGGYDFPGSNSGTDLWILFGWIPEQIVLQYDETNIGQLWPKILRAFNYGDVIITLGTGKMSSKAEMETGLAGEHDYAVLDMKEAGSRRYLLVKNPWLKGPSWKDHRNYVNKPDDDGGDDGHSSDADLLVDIEALPTNSSDPGTFWMEANDVMQYFEWIYLNWNPGLFKFRKDIHFVWDLSPSEGGPSPPGSLCRNPQHTIISEQGGPLWLLLSKHFKTKTKSEQLTQPSDDGGYITLYAFSGDGRRVSLCQEVIKQALYVDSPQALLQLELPPRTPYTIAVVEDELPHIAHTFSLSAFSNSDFSLGAAQSRYTTQTKTKSSWTNDTAGGNSDAATHSRNPQFSLHLPSSSALELVLETLAPNVSVHLKLLHGYGQRVYTIMSRDIIADSGDYRPGYAQAVLSERLAPGTYTIICSTFEPAQTGDFTLLVESRTQHQVQAIPKEGAGRIRTRFADASFGGGSRVLAAPLVPRRLTRVNFAARYVAVAIVPWDIDLQASAADGGGGSVSAHSPTRLTVEQGRGPNRKILIASGDGAFSDSVSGFRTEDIDLNPSMVVKQDMWLVLERLGGFQSVAKVEERVAVDMWADAADAMEFGVWREWER